MNTPTTVTHPSIHLNGTCAALAAAILNRLEDGDDLVPVRWWLEQLGQVELEPNAAAKVVALGERINEVLVAAFELVEAVENVA